MAKKSPSASKKSGKSPAKPTSKTASKLTSKAAAKKPTKNLAKKVAKPMAKIVKNSALKPIKKALSKAAVATKEVATKEVAKLADQKAKTKVSVGTVKQAEKVAEKPESVKPALMTKKGKPTEPEVAEEEAAPADAAVTKAEKVGKVKPIRIEKGNVEDEKAKWVELFKKYGKEKAINYKMSDTFPSLSPLQHKVLGWGFILKNDNDRLEVLFETGIRMLISNYKQ